MAHLIEHWSPTSAGEVLGPYGRLSDEGELAGAGRVRREGSGPDPAAAPGSAVLAGVLH